MDSSHDLDKATFRFVLIDPFYCRTEIPESMTVSGIHRAVIEGDIDKAKRCIESGESVNKKESQYGYSPLHLAVMCIRAAAYEENVSSVRYSGEEMLEFLLAERQVEMNARCSKGRTPLYLACFLEDIKSVRKLIEAGSDVNASDDENDRPLHVSLLRQEIRELLLEHGALIFTDNKWKNTMQKAIAFDCPEVMHMLLYYNVDANVPSFYGLTPFMIALKEGPEEIQEALLEYVDDFSSINYADLHGVSILTYALENESPFVKDIIERGADVDGAFLHCLRSDVDLETFKMVWERLRFNDSDNTIDLLSLLICEDRAPAYLSIIIESDNFEVAVPFFSKDDNYFFFVNKYGENEFDLEQLTILTCRLLEYGFCATSHGIGAVFSYYGYCELFRILLYMDNDLTRGWLPSMALPRLIFDIDFDLETVIDDIEDIPMMNLIQLLEYSVCPRLVDALLSRYSDEISMRVVISSLPQVPSLLELARNAARKHIWQSFGITSTCQFYTAVDHFRIPTFYKDILTFKRKMYSVSSFDILQYLLDQQGVEGNSKCWEGRTPVDLSAALRRIESAVKDNTFESNAYISNFKSRFPLHFVVHDVDICHLLIRHGAWIDAVDEDGRSVLHKAVEYDCVDVVHMLLYYNADANLPDNLDRTPFMAAINDEHVEMQEILLDYVDDFNRITSSEWYFVPTLALALQTNSPFLNDIIERGADVNYADDPRIAAESAFSLCLEGPVEVSTFKLVWERLRYNRFKNTIDLSRLIEIEPQFLTVMIESDNFELMVQVFENDSMGGDYYSFVKQYAAERLDLDQLTTFTCRLLEYGFRVSQYVIDAILSNYGYCELFRILLYMDNDLTGEWLPEMALCRLIFDIDFNLETIVDDIQDVPVEKLMQLLEYSVCPSAVDALIRGYNMITTLSGLPRLPSLIELARNAARKHIWRSLNITNNCQFYTAIDNLNAPSSLKNILTFRRKLYRLGK